MTKINLTMNKELNEEIKAPLWMLLELTHKCPLECPYCYNQLDFAKIDDQMQKEDWLRVMEEAREMGVVQIGFSGGEPLLNKDLPELVKKASGLGFYTNLITSGVGAEEGIVKKLKEAGLKNVQIGIQSSEKEIMTLLTNNKTAYEQKIKFAKEVKEAGMQIVINATVHKLNIDHVDKIIEFAHNLGAEYLEIANVQYYGWALENIDKLLPSKEQIKEAKRVTNIYRDNKENKMKVFFVVPDYHEVRPKACMNGWGSTFLTINPEGDALPCNMANTLPLKFPNVKNFSLQDIWNRSNSFNFFRGDEWMSEPCRTCDEKEKDFGGCRCQAFALTNDMNAADPVCEKSPHHNIVTNTVKRAMETSSDGLVYRNRNNSMNFIKAKP
jgi:pyrroloquinoline quinone biosynthesis protein E